MTALLSWVQLYSCNQTFGARHVCFVLFIGFKLAYEAIAYTSPIDSLFTVDVLVSHLF